MELTINDLLAGLSRCGVDYNYQDMNCVGVLFWKREDGTMSAVVAAGSFTVEIRDIGFVPEGEFFNFASNAWAKNSYPADVKKLQERIDNYEFMSKITVPFTNVVNGINQLNDDMKKKSRIILSPNTLNEGDMLLKFKQEGSNMVFRHPKVNKAFIANSEVKKDVVYKCRVISENSDAYLVEIIEEYSKVRFGMHVSPNGFIPSDIQSVNELRTNNDRIILRVNSVEVKEDEQMPPMHYDTKLFYDLIRILGIMPTMYMEILTGNSPTSVTLIRNVRNNDKEKQINIYLGSLNPYYGAQRR